MGRKIFEAVHLHNLNMKNRLIIYREVANGGVGAVIVGFTDVSQDTTSIYMVQ